MIYETDIYRMACDDSTADVLLAHIEKQAGELALLFGISHLPAGCKIQIDILDRNAFDQKKSLHFGKGTGSKSLRFQQLVSASCHTTRSMADIHPKNTVK